jgi:SAM-dependent methyltransferase
MTSEAMTAHGLALQAYFRGETEAQLIVRREDGYESRLPVRHFFRTPSEFSSNEVTALQHCRGRVLDIGAGSGLHSLELQSKGIPVTAIDVLPQAVEIMTERGVKDARRADILRFQGGPFDTLLMLGHGIGMVEDLKGLSRFLTHAHSLTGEQGQILLDSLDVCKTDDPAHLAYHEATRGKGRYVGEGRIQVEYEGKKGPYCGWLHVDPTTLAEQAERAGWTSEVLLAQEHGEFLARLVQTSGT